MTEGEALRILGLEVPGNPEAVRAAFSAQMQAFREARALAAGGHERKRLDRALALTVAARDRLLPADGRAFAITQEMPRIRRLPGRHMLVVLLLGGVLVVLGLIQDGSEPQTGTVEPEPPSHDVAVAPAVSRMLLDEVRVALVADWQVSGRLPQRTELEGIELPLPPDGWRWQGQRDGGFALVETSGEAWLLAAPLLEDGGLYWGCFSSRPGLADCFELGGDPILDRRLPRGQVDSRLLAEALERTAAGRQGGAYSAARWYRQALRQGDASAARKLAEQALASDSEASTAAALAWLERAVDMHVARGERRDALAVVARLIELRLAAGSADDVTRKWLDRCLELAGAGRSTCPGPVTVARELERRGEFRRAHWWYRAARTGGDADGLEGEARLLALGHLGAVRRREALRQLEAAVEDWPEFARRDAGRVAAELARIWLHGWGVAARPGEASWWAAQGARFGHAGAALDLATAFALGIGTARDSERAREVVQLYAAEVPVFEVAFRREVARRLAQGDGVDVDAEGARVWYRRAFELCERLAAAGDPDARFDLAGMYFGGHGVDRDLQQAAALYGELVGQAPIRATNMLAWIRATADDAATRDGQRALVLARRVVEQAPTATYLDTLAAALAEVGAFPEAVRTQQRALEELTAGSLPHAGGADIADRRERLEQRLEWYRQGRAWRDDGLG